MEIVNWGGTEIMLWGRNIGWIYQGHAYRALDRRYWTANWSGLFDTLERDGAMRYENKMWVSRTGKFVGYPYAVMNDYGDLICVEPRIH